MNMNEPIVLESNQNHATITNTGICPSLPASMGLGGGYVPMITETKEKDVEVYSANKASFFTHAESDIAGSLVATDYKDPPLITVCDIFLDDEYSNEY